MSHAFTSLAKKKLPKKEFSKWLDSRTSKRFNGTQRCNACLEQQERSRESITMVKQKCSICKEEKRKIDFLDDEWDKTLDRRRCKVCQLQRRLISEGSRSAKRKREG